MDGDQQTGPLPVMVWVHGGGFVSGDGGDRLYGPRYLLDRDVILVTFNYRLGPLGTLSLDVDDAAGSRSCGNGKCGEAGRSTFVLRRQSGPLGPEAGARLGTAKHSGIRRRSGTGDAIWRECRGHVRDTAQLLLQSDPRMLSLCSTCYSLNYEGTQRDFLVTRRIR